MSVNRIHLKSRARRIELDPEGIVGHTRGGILPSLRGVLFLTMSFGAVSAAAADKITYQDHVLPIFENRCFSCHNADRARGGLNLATYNATLAGGGGGEVVLPGDVDNSTLYLVIAHLAEPKMPPKQDQLPAGEIELVKQWIAGGLLENSGSEARKAKKPAFSMSLSQAPSVGKPSEPLPLPEHVLLEPVIFTDRPSAVAALATNPWAPIAAVSGFRQVLLYHTDTLELLGVLAYPEGTPQAMSFSRNGRLLLAGGGRGGQSGRVVVWNVADGQRVIEVGQEYDQVLAADISADQTQIALGGPSRVVRIYQTADGELLHEIRKHTDWVLAAVYSHDGVLLATGDRNGGLYVWESATGREFYTLSGHKAAITSLAWRDDSNVLASVSEDGTVKLWEMFNGNMVKSWSPASGSIGVLSVHFTHDNRLVVSGRDKTVRIFDQEGKEQRVFEAFADVALAAAFTHDGGRVIAGDWTGEIRVYNAVDGAREGALMSNPPPLAERLEAARRKASELEPIAVAAAAALEAAAAEAAAPRQKIAEAQQTVAQDQQRVTTASAKVDEAKVAVARATGALAEAAAGREAKKAESVKLAKAAADLATSLGTVAAEHAKAQEKAAAAQAEAAKTAQMVTLAKAELDTAPEDAALIESHQKALALVESADKMVMAMTDAVTAAETKLNSATESHGAAQSAAARAAAALAQEEAKVVEAEAALKTANEQMAAANTEMAQATAKASESARQAIAREEEAKAIIERADQAKLAAQDAAAKLADARYRVMALEAAQMNVERLASIEAYDAAQAADEQQTSVLASAQAAAAEANAAHDAAKSALDEAPNIVQQKQDALTAAQKAVEEAAAAVAAAQALAVEKEVFLTQMRQTAAEAAARAEKDPQSQPLSAAVAKVTESLPLLTQDLADSKARITERESDHTGAQAAMASAREELNKAKAALAEAPKRLELQAAAAAEAAAKLEAAETAARQTATNLAHAKALMDSLTAQYHAALPK